MGGGGGGEEGGQGWDSWKNMMGGTKVELNPKPKKIPVLGQFGTLKYTCTLKTW